MKKFVCMLLVCVMALSLTACGGKETASVSTDGSTSMQKVINALGEAFIEDTGANFTYNATGSGTGIKAVKDGTCDIGLSSRYLKDSEKAEGLKETILAIDGIAIIVHTDNPVADLTVEQISEFLASRAAVSAGDRGYRYLCDWVSQNSNRLCGKSDSVEVLGALDGNRAYIIRSVFERVLQEAGYSTAAMVSYLKQEHLIETRGRASTKGKRINGIPTECFCLLLPSVELDDENIDELPL